MRGVCDIPWGQIRGSLASPNSRLVNLRADRLRPALLGRVPWDHARRRMATHALRHPAYLPTPAAGTHTRAAWQQHPALTFASASGACARPHETWPEPNYTHTNWRARARGLGCRPLNLMGVFLPACVLRTCARKNRSRPSPPAARQAWPQCSSRPRRDGIRARRSAPRTAASGNQLPISR